MKVRTVEFKVKYITIQEDQGKTTYIFQNQSPYIEAFCHCLSLSILVAMKLWYYQKENKTK